MDSQGTPHILYTKDTGPSSQWQLYYAFWDGTAWQTQVVDGNAVVAYYISLVLDSQDRPHISYVIDGKPNDKLQHAVWNGAAWQTKTVEMKDGPQWASISLVVDANNRPHISYYAGDDDALRYAHDDGSGWQLQTVVAPPFFFSGNTSLAVDGNNYPHIAYTRNDEELAYAQWNGATWQIQTVLDVPVNSNLVGRPSLALDSANNPHISYAYDMDDTIVSLRYVFWTGAEWQNEILDNSGSAGFYNAIAIDSLDQTHVAYYKGGYGDLRYLHWGTNWQIRTVPDSGQIQAVDIQVDESSPHLMYHNVSTTLFNEAQWASGWDIQAITGISSPVTDSSLVIINSHQYVSFYDADNHRLLVADWDGSAWTIRVIDNQGDVGRYNQIMPIGTTGLQVAVAYWDATNYRIKLAVYSILDNTVEIYPHTMQPVLSADSGPLSATSSSSGDVAVTYWDGANLALRYAVWDKESTSWVIDEPVAAFAGRLNSLQSDALEGIPVVAYYDEINDAILFAYRDESGWQVETAVADAGTVTSLDLELGFQSRQYPRLAYNTATDSRFAYKENSTWAVEIIDDNVVPSEAVALALDRRPYLAYPYGNSGLAYIFRSATMDVNTAVPYSTGGTYNPVTPCAAVLEFFFNSSGYNRAPSQFHTAGFGGEATSLNDDGIFQALAGLFSGTAGGQHYIDLYFDHIAEMGQLGLDDPPLLWDAFGTLQNFLPGLEALVTGRGDEFVVTQQMVDDALDVWTRLAAAAGPELAGVINAELAASNDLQDFVGLTFNEWAEAIGVTPPGAAVYLPIIRMP